MGNVFFNIFPNENFIDLGMFQCGREACTPCHSFGPVTRNHYLFHYVLSGTGTLMADDAKGITQTYSVRSGQGFLIFPEQITTYYADQHSPWEYSWIEFDGLRVKEALSLTDFSLNHPIYHPHSKDLQEQMVKEMNYIISHPKESSFHLLGHLYLFFDYFIQSAKSTRLTQSSKMSDYYIQEAIHYMEQNFQNDISIEEIAAVCGINRSCLGKIFRNSIGRSPQEFLMNYRMVKATELLKLTTLSIADIGTAVGYGNPLHFSRAFKNVYGVSPREWRNENK
jgi:AraC-like DNA-binding protein